MEETNGQSSEVSILGEYLKNRSPYFQERITEMFTLAFNKGRFDDLRIPLDLFVWATDSIFNHEDRQEEVVSELCKRMDKLNLTIFQKGVIVAGISQFFSDGVFTDTETGLTKDYSLSETLLAFEADRLLEGVKHSEFSWNQVMRKLATLETINEKIQYLIEQRTEYDQVVVSRPDGRNFGYNCDLEINKLKEIRDLQKENVSSATPNNQSAASYFIWKKSKIDLIRVLDALYELKCFENPDGQIPSKEVLMKKVGELFGVDLSKYDVDLSQAMNDTSLEASLKVFHKMIAVAQKRHCESLNNKDSKY